MAERGHGRLPIRVARVIESTEGLIGDAAWLSEAGGKAQKQYERAVRQHGQARDLMEAGQHEAALQMAQQSRETLIRALNRADRPLAEEQVRKAVEQSHALIERAASREKTEGQQGALERARMHQSRAEENLANGRLAASLAEVRAVRGVLERSGI
jgi:hypothetical protein